MTKTYKWIGIAICALVIFLAIRSFNQDKGIDEAYADVFKAQVHLADITVKLETLDKRVKDLEEMKEFDERRIAELEGRIFSKQRTPK